MQFKTYYISRAIYLIVNVCDRVNSDKNADDSCVLYREQCSLTL